MKNGTGLFEVEDILQQRCTSNGDVEYLVRWQLQDLLPKEEQTQWVKAKNNLGLVDYITRNRSNPHSCTLNRNEIHKESDPLESVMPSEVLALRQMIFDQLGERRYTSDGQKGIRRRVTVALPFSTQAFLATFDRFSGSVRGKSVTNKSFYMDGQELLNCIGAGFATRGFTNSTVCYVNCAEKIHVTWQYKARVNYIHSSCPRCTHAGDKRYRPTQCSNYEKVNIYGPPWLYLTFTVGRRNRVLNS